MILVDFGGALFLFIDFSIIFEVSKSENGQLREATLAMIANLFYDNTQTQTLRRIYMIMDKSGDG